MSESLLLQAPRVNGPDWLFCMEGSKMVTRIGAVAEHTLNSGLWNTDVYCWVLFSFVVIFKSSPEGTAVRGKNTISGRKEAIIAGCLFVANRMLKWQICKFVREESLVFIFISQSGFLLAEQQARKRPILTT